MIKKIVWAFLILLITLTSCAYYNTFYNAEMYYEKGIKDFKESLEKNNINFSKKNFNLAIEKSEKVLVNYPDSKWCDDAQYLIAVSNFYKNNFRKAKKEIEEFFEKYPSSDLKDEMNMWYGRIFWKMGSPEMAIHHWKQMVSETKDNELKANIYYSIAEVFEFIGKIDSTIYYFDQTTKVRGGSEKHGQAQYNIAELYLKIGNMEQAIVNIEKVGQFAIGNDLKQKREVLLLKIYRSAGQYEKAEKLIHKKLNNEKNKEIWDELELELGLLYRDVGDTSAALTRFKSITENTEYKKSKSSAAAFYYIGMMNLIDIHDYKKAEKNFSLVQKENAKSEFVFDAKQRANQLKRFDKIKTAINKTQAIVNKVIKDLNTPEEDRIIAEIDTVDKSPEEIKNDLEKAKNDAVLANIDTLKTFEDYYKSRYELAEIYYFDFNFKDSGKVILKKIIDSQYFNPFLEQSLYALYYINKLEKNNNEADFYKDKLNMQNAESPYISFIKTGKVILPEYYKTEKELFECAETFVESNPDTAIKIFKELIENYSENPYQGKSAANIAWIMENNKYDLDESILWYKTVIDSFPQDESVDIAKVKYKLLQKVVTMLNQASDTSKVENVSDSLNITNIPDSTKLTKVDSVNKIGKEIIKKDEIESHQLKKDKSIDKRKVLDIDETELKEALKGKKKNNEKDLQSKVIEE